MKEKILEILKNPKFLTALIGVLGVGFFNIAKFVEYFVAYIKFNYYGIDIGFYQYSTSSFIVNFLVSIFIVCGVGLCFYCCNKILGCFRVKKIKWQEILEDFILLVAINLVYIYVYANFDTGNNIANILTYTLYIILLIIVEAFISFFLKKSRATTSESAIPYDILELIKSIMLLICIIIFCIYGMTNFSLKLHHSYRVTDDNKVLTYTNPDYSIVLNCEIKDDEIIIHKGTQTKVNNEDLYSELKYYKKITIKSAN